ncbi:MAG: bacteriophage abortive infection AbiH family protein [Lachnospiraceae bacterium]|nr:bacteriophage abortive infection AbiH family protein [Lachnospiraceae bacterium]
MDILVIGNGFDLAHGLPTRYIDFLEWTKKEYNLLKDDSHRLEIENCINNNFWINYFLSHSLYKKENWIDFENEILKVIKQLDEDMLYTHSGLYSFIPVVPSKIIVENNDKYFFYDHVIGEKPERITYKNIIDMLYNDLNRLIRALEIYLYEYVDNIEIKKKLKDIDNIYIDYILSFNYTNTFKKCYDKEERIIYDYIHGKINIKNTIDTNNMVLGIEEYLPENRKNKAVELIAFKKFYQRIYKKTGCQYKKWVNTIKHQWENLSKSEKKEITNNIYNGYFRNKNRFIHNLYIFGHSLDVTDGDVLRDLILNDNVYTTIFYHTKEVMGQQIANLVKIIGQDELIKRTGGITKTIEFKQQQDA